MSGTDPENWCSELVDDVPGHSAGGGDVSADEGVRSGLNVTPT